MGSCLSCRSSSSFAGIRIVHLSGYVEDFEHPITSTEVIGDSHKHFLCTRAHLIHGSKSIGPSVILEKGGVYFLLPYTLLQSDTSPANMVALAAKLTAVAKNSQSGCKAQETVLPRGNSNVIGTNYQFSLKPDMQLRPDMQRSPTVATWKPILDAIIEMSMERSAELK